MAKEKVVKNLVESAKKALAPYLDDAVKNYDDTIKNFKRTGPAVFGKKSMTYMIPVEGDKGFKGYHLFDKGKKKFVTGKFIVDRPTGASIVREQGKITSPIKGKEIPFKGKVPDLPEAPKEIKDAVKAGKWDKVKAWLKKHKVTIGAAGAGALGGYILSDD